MRILSNIICAFIPSKRLRHTIRKRNKKLENMNHSAAINQILEELHSIERKLVNKNDIYDFKNNIKFYLPFYPVDFIQRVIVDRKKFFEEDELISLDEKLQFWGNIQKDIIDTYGTLPLASKTGKKFQKIFDALLKVPKLNLGYFFKPHEKDAYSVSRKAGRKFKSLLKQYIRTNFYSD